MWQVRIESPRKRHQRILWVGDSHASTFHRYAKNFTSDDSVVFVCYGLGPRLIHSVLEHSYPISKLQIALLRVWRALDLVVALGEIDCRMYLATEDFPRYRDVEWVNRFVALTTELGLKLAAHCVPILAPAPPSDIGASDPTYPKRGLSSDRIHGSSWLTGSLREQTLSRGPTIQLIEISELLSAYDGSLDSTWTTDGIHVNNLGANRVISSILTRDGKVED
jgi:hypothetical protein